MSAQFAAAVASGDPVSLVARCVAGIPALEGANLGILYLSEPAAPALPEPEPESALEPEPVAVEPAPPKLEPLEARPKHRWFRRRERDLPAAEAPEVELPKHVRLLPPSERTDRPSDDVTELFDLPEPEERSRP